MFSWHHKQAMSQLAQLQADTGAIHRVAPDEHITRLKIFAVFERSNPWSTDEKWLLVTSISRRQ